MFFYCFLKRLFMNAMLNTALRAARRAGQVINRASLRIERLYVDKKGPKDYVTEVDREAEQIIIDTLQQAYPDHDILAEESGLVRALSAQTSGDSQLAREGADIDTGSSVDTTAAPAEYQWVIDPLDGTTNFIHGFPNYAISIGLLHRQQLAQDRKSTRLNSSHVAISYAVFCLKNKTKKCYIISVSATVSNIYPSAT